MGRGSYRWRIPHTARPVRKDARAGGGATTTAGAPREVGMSVSVGPVLVGGRP